MQRKGRMSVRDRRLCSKNKLFCIIEHVKELASSLTTKTADGIKKIKTFLSCIFYFVVMGKIE